jgi:hypothetical protein
MARPGASRPVVGLRTGQIGRLTTVRVNLTGPTGAAVPGRGTVFLVVRRSRDRKVKVTAGDISRSGPVSSQVRLLFRRPRRPTAPPS